MQVVPSGGQICNQCKWRYLVAKFGTNASKIVAKDCRAGLSSTTSYRYFIAGLDIKGNQVGVKDHLLRGGSLLRMTEAWLEIWEPREWISLECVLIVNQTFADMLPSRSTISYVFSCRYRPFDAWHLTFYSTGLLLSLLSRLQALSHTEYCKYLNTYYCTNQPNIVGLDAFLKTGSSNCIHSILYGSLRLSICNRGKEYSLESLCWNAKPCCCAWRLEAKEHSSEHAVMQ